MPRISFATENPIIAEHFPVLPMKKLVPEWYKKLDMHIGEGGLSLDAAVRSGSVHGNKTLRYCVPVLDFLTSGYAITSAVHLKIRNGQVLEEGGPTGLDYVTSENRLVETHSNRQCPVHIGGAKRTYPKVGNVWTVKTPPDYSCLFYQPFYDSLEPKLRFFPAIVDTDSYPRPVNFPGWVDGDAEVELLPGQPIMCVFPFKREGWRMDIRVEPEQRNSLMNHLLDRAYAKFFHKKKVWK